jgi:hypothetical protein
MQTIDLNKVPFNYNKETKIISVSEKHAPFATSYQVVGKFGTQKFDLSHSTGPEFDPKTRWVYKSAEPGVTLEVCNDAEITKQLAKNYLIAKIR